MDLERKITNQSLVAAAACIVIAAGMKIAASIVAPILLALFFAITVHPVVAKLERWKIPPAISIVSILSLLVLLLSQGIALLLNGTRSLISDWPRYHELFNQFINDKQQVWPWLADFDFSVLTTNFSQMTNVATGFLGTMQGVLVNGFLVLLITAMLLFEWPLWGKLIGRAAGDRQLALNWAEKLNVYIAVKFGASVVTGLFVAICLKFIGHDYYPVWGFIAMLLNMLPTVGSILAAIPPALLALVVLEPWQFGATLGVYLGVNILVGNILEPKFLGNQVGLPTSVIIISMLFWGWMFGITGIFLSTPLTISVATFALKQNQSNPLQAAEPQSLAQ